MELSYPTDPRARACGVRRQSACLQAGAQAVRYPRLFNDLLSSQPLCFNLFGPLAGDLDLATEVARRLWPSRVDRVTAVRFEYSPGRQDPRYLNNGSAADVLFEHSVPQGGRGVIAIETKYHEDLKGTPATPKPRYQEIIEQSRAFASPQLPPEFSAPPLQQILLDHLLVLATRETDGLNGALSVLVYPELNTACQSAAMRYAAALDPAAPPTFETRTMQSICAAIAEVMPSEWITAFAERYLDLSRVDRALAQASLPA